MKGEKVILSAEELRAGYGDKIVIRGVNLALREGDFMGILGPNGSGKTTLLRALTGIITPASGEVRFRGRSLNRIPSGELARSMAVVAQQPPAALDLSVEDIVLLGRIPYFQRLQWWPSVRDRKVLTRILNRTDLTVLRRENFQNLSGGEQQRVMIALALAQEPELLWLDEPNLHLDINYQAEIFALLSGLNREDGLTVVTVLHDLNLAAAYCRRLLFLKSGRIEKMGTAAELITPEKIEKIFGARMEVIPHPSTGRPLIFPRV